jgi:hypothetical protein
MGRMCPARSFDTELMLPKGPKIAFFGGTDYADHNEVAGITAGDKVLTAVGRAAGPQIRRAELTWLP